MSIKELERTEAAEQKIEDKTVKQLARELIERLPDDLDWDRLYYHLHVCQLVFESEREMEENGGVSNDEAREYLKKWLD